MSEREPEIRPIPASKVTDELVARTADLIALMRTTQNLTEAQSAAAEKMGISVPTIRWYLSRIRQKLGAPKRASLAELAAHPEVRRAIEAVLTRKERADRLSLQSARHLNVIMPSGERLGVDDFLKSLYPREGVNASACYAALKGRCIQHQVVFDDGSPASVVDLPKERSIRRFLQQWREEFIAVRRGRARKHDFEVEQQPYVTRDVSRYRPGELWIGDHTELDFAVINARGYVDRRWISSFLDIRTGLIVGYHLSWQPNSQTISLAFRNGVLGTQLRAFTAENKYKPVSIRNVPETVMIDNGKDYRSKQTQRLFGKIDFDDAARLSIQRLTHLQYVLPYHGQSKAQQERWFRVIQQMIRHLPGYKGNKYQNKPDSYATDVRQGRLLPYAQFDALVAIAVNVYNNRVRRSLKGQSPLQCYLTNQTHQRAIDERVLDFLLMKVEGRRIRRCQVTLFSKEYYSDALMGVNEEMADVYYDPKDLGFVTVYVHGEFAAVASNKEMIGQDEKGWLRILRDRTKSEREMKSQLAAIKQGVSDADARRMLVEGELLNVVPVLEEVFTRRPLEITQITGLEQQAKEHQEALDREKESAEIEREAKKKRKQSHLSVAAMNSRIV
jgi:transposase InsO family protein